MMTKNNSYNRNQVQMLSVDDLVPDDHILRDIDKAIDFIPFPNKNLDIPPNPCYNITG